MTHTKKVGRLGNQIMRNLAVSILAEKHDLYVSYYDNEKINKLGIELFCGTSDYSHDMQNLTDDNYFTIYNTDELKFNLNPNGSFFQTKEISKFIYNYLHKYTPLDI